MLKNLSRILGNSVLRPNKLLWNINFNYIRPKKKVIPRDPFQYQEKKIHDHA